MGGSKIGVVMETGGSSDVVLIVAAFLTFVSSMTGLILTYLLNKKAATLVKQTNGMLETMKESSKAEGRAEQKLEDDVK